jgi:hydrogenase maturation protease
VIAPVLVFGWGNPSRGDDALGPLFVERVAALRLPGVECLTDFQLQVEHALDLRERRRILFVDASLDTTPPFTVRPLAPARDVSFTTHAMSPEAVLQVYAELEDADPPPSWLLAIRGVGYELGDELSTDAAAHLDAAIKWFSTWLSGDAVKSDIIP